MCVYGATARSLLLLLLLELGSGRMRVRANWPPFLPVFFCQVGEMKWRPPMKDNERVESRKEALGGRLIDVYEFN